MFTQTVSPSTLATNGDPKSLEPVKFILTDREKYRDDKVAVKRIFEYFEALGSEQVIEKQHSIRKLYQLAEGQINIEDYVQTDADYLNIKGIGREENKLAVDKLDFYPIIPTIVNGILGSYDKSYTEYVAYAVNPEATNDIQAQLDDNLRSALLNNVEALFQVKTANDTPDVVAQKRQLMQESEEVRKYFSTNFRTTLEQWAQHTMNLENEWFKMPQIERQLLKQQLVTGCPTVHIDYYKGNYRATNLNERNTFCIRSDESDDYSESQVFGWFEFCEFSDILSKYSSRLTTEQVETISEWSQQRLTSSFVVNDMIPTYSEGQRYAESRQNVQVVKDAALWHGFKSMYDEMGMSMEKLRLTTIYFYIPRKVGTLTLKSRETTVTELVDEYFKPTIKPVYMEGQPKTADTLLSGEHIDWFYIPELWRGKKLSTGTPTLNSSQKNSHFKIEDIWVELDRCEIQFMNPHYKYGVYIPVHGGPAANQHAETASVVKTAAPWQIMFNWLHNRNKQLLSTEIGKFFLLPESLIPAESLEGEWAEHSLEKFATVAWDTGLAPTSNPLAQGGAASLALQGGYGQVVDLSKNEEIIGKVNIANIFRQECYQSVGLTPEYLLGDVSPTQSARSTAMGQERSATQIQHLFTRLNDILVLTRTTMLTAAQYIASKKPTVEMSYTTAQAGRVLFKTTTEDFTLHQLGVFVKSNGSDLAVIEAIKTYVAGNNTMGADSHEVATLLSFKSLPELFTKLKDIRREREYQQEKEHQRQLQLQREQIEAAKLAQEKEIAARAEEKALDRESMIMQAQIKAIGYAQDDAEGIQNSVLKLQTANADQQAMYERARLQYQQQSMKTQQADKMLELKERDTASKEVERMKAIEQRDRELDLREQEIKARNARTKAID